MIRISNIRIGTKLGIMTGTGIALVALMVATIIVSGTQAQNASDASARRATIAIVAGEAKAALVSMRLDAVYVRLTDNAEVLKANAASFNAQYAKFNGFVAQLLATAITVPTQQRIKNLKANGDAYAEGASKIIAMKTEAAELQMKANGAELSPAGKARIAAISVESEDISRTKTMPAAKAATEAVDELVEDTKKTSRASQITVVETLKSAEKISLGVGLVTVAVLIVTAIFGAVSIAQPLRALIRPIAQLAEGNFVAVVPGLGRKDEVGQIAEAVSDMAKRVRVSMIKIKGSAAEVTNSAIEISGSTTNLSQRTEEQAASLEEIAASMEQISSQVKRNAESAQAANVSASATRQMADTGGSVVARTVEAMAKIEESSRKISDIIGVIDEIARQTNLLALNAAVEAARAGDAGRGFAVVASEVRSLAQRSSQAAKDITNLITTSNSQVKDGVDLVGRAGSTLIEIMGSLKEVATIVSDIASASAEQSTGVEEINKAITQMDEVTQQNSALVEENAATAKSLEHQAQAMDQEVAYFQIEEGGARGSAGAGAKKAAGTVRRSSVPAARAA